MVVLTSFPPPTEGIHHTQPNTTVHVESKDLGKGTLYIAESRVSWVGEHGQGFSIEYPAIALHGVTRDVNAFPDECLYLMITAQINESDDGLEEESEDEEEKMSEICFVPDNRGELNAMFKAMTECQALHPDPDDSVSEDEEGCFDDAEDDGAEYDVSAAESGFDGVENFNNSESRVIVKESGDEPMDVGQFDDAEPEH